MGQADHAVHVAARTIMIDRYSIVACYVVVVYDWLTSLDEEVALIHQARWTAVKAAYLVCRYYPLVSFLFHIWGWILDHDEATCRRVLHPLYICLIPLQLSAQVVLMLRTYAFAGKERWVLVLLSLGLVALLGFSLWVQIANIRLVKSIFTTFGKSGCFGDTDHEGLLVPGTLGAPHMGSVFLAAFLYDAMTMSIVVYYCIRIHGVQGSLGFDFICKAVGVFAAMSALNIVSAALYMSPNSSLNGMGSYFALLLPDVLACRLILMLRRRLNPTASMHSRERSRLIREAIEMVPQEPEPDSVNSTNNMLHEHV